MTAYLIAKRGGHFLVLNFRIKITNVAKAIINDNASYVVISLASFQVGLRKTNHHLSGLSPATHIAIVLVELYRITLFSTRLKCIFNSSFLTQKVFYRFPQMRRHILNGF